LSDKRVTEIIELLNGATTVEGLSIHAEVINTDEQMIKVIIETREELPIIVDINDDQILAIANLWDASEVKQESEAEMMRSMLRMNIALPLSAFAQTGSQYQLFGALSTDSRDEVIIEEVELLSSNLEAVLEDFAIYLK
jgi:hypothetical protein